MRCSARTASDYGFRRPPTSPPTVCRTSATSPPDLPLSEPEPPDEPEPGGGDFVSSPDPPAGSLGGGVVPVLVPWLSVPVVPVPAPLPEFAVVAVGAVDAAPVDVGDAGGWPALGAGALLVGACGATTAGLRARAWPVPEGALPREPPLPPADCQERRTGVGLGMAGRGAGAPTVAS